ncbi:MAG: hypothetical protein B7Z15_08465 [Rhizobiales bacterium 32-66-8]|nr:MAG: hypothetical protein B7Z15_08465 [Rhizobiales bacterium 32-66-8]
MTDALPSDTPAPQPADTEARAAILKLTGACGPSKTICPSDAARVLAPGDGWQRVLPVVRRAAVALAQEGRLMIYRKGKPVDPTAFRGVYRLGLPRDE